VETPPPVGCPVDVSTNRRQFGMRRLLCIRGYFFADELLVISK